MNIVKLFGLVVLLVVLTSQSSVAQISLNGPNIRRMVKTIDFDIQNSNGRALKPGVAYRVTIHCDTNGGTDYKHLFYKTRDLPFKPSLKQIFHGMILSSSSGEAIVPTTVNGNTSVDFRNLSSTTLVPYGLYAAERQGASSEAQSRDRLEDCGTSGVDSENQLKQEFLVIGGDKIEVLAYTFWAIDSDVHPIALIFSAVAAQAANFGTLLPDLVQPNEDKLRSAEAIIDAYKTLQTQFEQHGGNIKHFSLREGQTVIQTVLSNIYITVTPQDEGFLKGNTNFSTRYRDLFVVPGETQAQRQVRLPATLDFSNDDKMRQSCSRLEQRLRARLIHNADVAYIMYNEAIQSNANKSQVVSCLGRNLMDAAVDSMDRYVYLADRDKITRTEYAVISTAVGVLPEPVILQNPENERNTIRFLRAASKLARNIDDRTILQDLQSTSFPQISFKDDSQNASATSEGQSILIQGGPKDVADRLAGAGYMYFDCLAVNANHDDLDRRWDDTEFSALIFKTDSDGNPTFEELLALRIAYRGNKISQIQATDRFVPELRAIMGSSCAVLNRAVS